MGLDENLDEDQNKDDKNEKTRSNQNHMIKIFKPKKKGKTR